MGGHESLAEEEDEDERSELGGGALLDAGAYPIKISQIFLGISQKCAGMS